MLISQLYLILLGTWLRMVDEVALAERSNSILHRAIFVNSGGSGSHAIQLFFRKLGELGLPVVFFLPVLPWSLL